jgi:hypothetical protein
MKNVESKTLDSGNAFVGPYIAATQILAVVVEQRIMVEFGQQKFGRRKYDPGPWRKSWTVTQTVILDRDANRPAKGTGLPMGAFNRKLKVQRCTFIPITRQW